MDDDDLIRILTRYEPEELRKSYLALPGDGIKAAGSSVPNIGALQFAPLFPGSDLAVPVGTALEAPIDYMGVYVTLNEYFIYDRGEGSYSADEVIDALARNHTSETLVINLALLNVIATDPTRLAEFQGAFLQMLEPTLAERLKNLLGGGKGPGKRHLLARQPILAALRLVIQDDIGGTSDDNDVPTLVGAALFSQAVAVTLAAETAASDEVVGVPLPLFFEVMRSGLMYESDDMWSSIDRVLRLWRTFGGKVKKFPLRKPPAELLAEATGLEIEDLLGLAFGLFAHATQWEPGKPPFLAKDFGSEMPAEKLDRFRRLMAADTAELRSAFEQRTTSRFDYLPIQERPVLSTDAGLLVLDIGYLWDRVTSGLYWMVHDYEKNRSDRDRQSWSQGFGEAVELMAEAELRAMAPHVLGGGTAFYTEEDFETAYGEMRRCDAAIDFGADVLLVEIVSGQLSVPTRIEGDLEQFKRDTKRLVLDKCEQLHAACEALLTDPVALLGYSPIAMRLVPLLVVGGGYPVNPFTMLYVREALAGKGLLTDPRVEDLCIIDMSELEILEGLAEKGKNPSDVLRQWKASGIANVSLRNHVLRTEGGGRELRPTRMETSVNKTFEKIIASMRLRKEDAA